MSTYNLVIRIERTHSKIKSKNTKYGCSLCSRHILFETKKQVLSHLTREHHNEISREYYLKIRKIVRTIEQGHQEGVLIL